MNKNYLRGRITEYKIMKVLEGQGFTCFRTAGSHGAADIIAVGHGEVRFIQAKRQKKKSSLRGYDKDIEKLKALTNGTKLKVKQEMWIWLDRKGFLICDVK